MSITKLEPRTLWETLDTPSDKDWVLFLWRTRPPSLDPDLFVSWLPVYGSKVNRRVGVSLARSRQFQVQREILMENHGNVENTTSVKLQENAS